MLGLRAFTFLTQCHHEKEAHPCNVVGEHTTGQENVVCTRPGDVKKGAAVSIHTEAASVANLVPSAA